MQASPTLERPAETPAPPSVGAVETAVGLLAAGFWPVPIVEGEKRPRGAAWGAERPTAEKLRLRYVQNPGDGVGLCLGPECGPGGVWLVDVEGDGPQADESRRRLFGDDVPSLGWRSSRGEHRLYAVDGPRLLDAIRAAGGREGKVAGAGVFHLGGLPDLELRIGGFHADGKRKQLQSVCPPTIGTDGRSRTWFPERLAELPESVYERLTTVDPGPGDVIPMPAAVPSSEGVGWTIHPPTGGGDPVAAAAFRGEVANVAGSVEGGRNNQLHKSALKLGGYVAAGRLAESEVRGALLSAALGIGLGRAEAEPTIDRGVQAGYANPKHRDDDPARPLRIVSSDGAEGSIDARLAKRPCTDLGNGERLAARFGEQIRFCHAWGKWLVWDGRRFAIDRTGAIDRLAKQTARLILREAATADDDKERKALIAHARASESRAGLANMMATASTETGIPVLVEEMDRDGWLLNVLNGTIDLRTGELRAHSQADMITQLCPVEFDPDAKCPLWDATLSLFFAGDQSLIAFWQRLCGYFLTGVIRDHILPIAYGDGSNGKSTILGTMQGLLGPDFAMKAPSGLLMAKAVESHPTDRADLFGKRLVLAIETEGGRRLNETLVKELTGGDRVRARRMREDFWEFPPTHKIVVASNHKPVIRDTDNGIWRRLLLVPFTIRMPKSEADTDMAGKLVAEYPGILAWAVRGCLAWRVIGLAEPEAVRASTAEYRGEQDLIGAFLDECTMRDAMFRTKCGLLFGAFQEWAKKSGECPGTLTAFGTSMRERGFRTVASNGKWYLGVGLRAADGPA